MQTFSGRTLATSLMGAWTVGGMILAAQLPMLGAIILSLAGLPALLVSLAWGLPWFLTYGGLTLGLAFWWGGWASSLLLIPLLLLPGAVLALVINHGYESFQAIGIAILVACFFSTSLWGLSPLFSAQGTQIWSMGEEFRSQGLTAIEKVKTADRKNVQNVDPERLELFFEQFRSWIDFVALLVPVTFLFVWHMFSLGVFYIGASSLAHWFNYRLQPLPRFSTWRFNWNLIWVMFLGWFLFYGAESLGPIGADKAARFLGANCLAISKILFFITGLSLLTHYLEVNQLSYPIRLGLSVIACFFNQLLVWLGIADIWFDFRTPRPPARPADTSNDSDSLF